MDYDNMRESQQTLTIFSLPSHIIQSICQLSVDSDLNDYQSSRLSFLRTSLSSYKHVLYFSATCSYFRKIVLGCTLKYRLYIKVNEHTSNLTETVDKFGSFIRSNTCWLLTKAFIQIGEDSWGINPESPKLSSFLLDNATIFGKSLKHLSIVVVGRAEPYFKWFLPMLQDHDFFDSENLQIFLCLVAGASHFNPEIHNSFPTPHKITQIRFPPKSPSDLSCLSKYENLKLLQLVDLPFSLDIAHLSSLQKLEELFVSDLLVSTNSSSYGLVFPHLKALKIMNQGTTNIEDLPMFICNRFPNLEVFGIKVYPRYDFPNRKLDFKFLPASCHQMSFGTDLCPFFANCNQIKYVSIRNEKQNGVDDLANFLKVLPSKLEIFCTVDEFGPCMQSIHIFPVELLSQILSLEDVPKLINIEIYDFNIEQLKKWIEENWEVILQSRIKMLILNGKIIFRKKPSNDVINDSIWGKWSIFGKLSREKVSLTQEPLFDI